MGREREKVREMKRDKDGEVRKSERRERKRGKEGKREEKEITKEMGKTRRRERGGR